MPIRGYWPNYSIIVQCSTDDWLVYCNTEIDKYLFVVKMVHFIRDVKLDIKN